MTIPVRQNTLRVLIIGPFIDPTDGSPQTSLTIANTDIRLTKGAALAVDATNGASAREDGYYAWPVDAADVDVVGCLHVQIQMAGSMWVRHYLQVIEEAVFDAIYADGAAGFAQKADVDQSLQDIHLQKLFAEDYNAATPPGVATALLNELTEDSTVTPGISRFTQTALQEAPTGTGSGLTAQETRDAMKLAPTGGAPAAGSIDEHLDSLDITKLTAPRATNLDNLDATVSSRSSHAPTAIVSSGAINTSGGNVNRVTDITNVVRADLEQILGTALTETNAGDHARSFSFFYDVTPTTTKTVNDVGVSGSGLTEQQVRDAMKLAPTAGVPAAGSIDEHLDSLDETKLTTARADNLDNLDAAISTRSSHDVAAIWNEPQAAYTTVGTFGYNLDVPSSKIEADILALNDVSAADILDAQLTEAYAAKGVSPTLSEFCYMIHSTLGDFQRVGTTITTRQIDGLTPAMTYTLDDPATPTSRTRTT